jgi:hypothetical protein
MGHGQGKGSHLVRIYILCGCARTMWSCLCTKNESGAIFPISCMPITMWSLSLAVAGQYDAGHTDVTLLCVEQQKWVGPCKHVVNYIYAPNLTFQQSKYYLIGNKVSNRASEKFDSFTSVTYLSISQVQKSMQF